jgi:tetratricopeptide (TPR) repeat protein
MKIGGFVFGIFLSAYLSLPAFSQIRNIIFIHKPVYNSAFLLNETATLLFEHFSFNRDSVKKSLRLVDEAISTDSTYYTARISKVAMLFALGQNNEILKELDEIIKLYRQDPQLICMEGYILEGTGQKADAMLKYKEADKLYDRLIKDNENLVYNKIGKAFLQLFLKSKDEGIREYKKIARTYQDKQVILMKNTFLNFKKEEFLKSYCLPPQPLDNVPEICLNETKKLSVKLISGIFLSRTE